MGAKNIYGNNMNDGDDVERGFKKTALFKSVGYASRVCRVNGPRLA